MDCQERLAEQAAQLKAANPDSNVWVYRNEGAAVVQRRAQDQRPFCTTARSTPAGRTTSPTPVT
jgi:hypothetical protein